MGRRRWGRGCRGRFATIVLTLGIIVSPALVTANPAPAEALTRAYDLAYNLDHDEAISTLQEIISEHPDDPAPYRGVAALTWLRMLFLRGAVLVDAQLTATVRSSGQATDPPEDLVETFRSHIERAIELSEAAVESDDDDPDAHYELGASVALQASYKASIDGEGIRALRDAKRAYESHERVLELDPSRKDAGLTIGIYRYLVSLLPRAVRMMAYLVGFDGGKDEALRLIEEAAAYPGETEAEAQFALVLLYNRERQYRDAQRVLARLKRQFPRNRLIWLESASTWLRDERAQLADRDLRLGLAKLSRDDRPRMLAEDQMWLLKRGSAGVALGRVHEARADLEDVLAEPAHAWVHGRAHVELGKLADLEDDRRQASEQYDRGRKLCRDANDRRCERAAEAYKKHGYPLD